MDQGEAGGDTLWVQDPGKMSPQGSPKTGGGCIRDGSTPSTSPTALPPDVRASGCPGKGMNVRTGLRKDGGRVPVPQVGEVGVDVPWEGPTRVLSDPKAKCS